MLTTLALAYRGPLLVAPAMNPAMFEHAATQAAIATLRSRGAVIVEPAVGDVACGENGQGKLASISTIVREAAQILSRGQWLAGRHILITGGPTHEPIDAVRFVGNRSSGKMAVALARAATLCGASVTLVLGPTDVVVPDGVEVRRVQTAVQMLEACQRVLPSADGVIGCAAVADYRPSQTIDGKRRRTDEPWSLELIPNPDIIAELAAKRKPGAWALGFAAEPADDPSVAREKVTAKGLDGIALNNVSRTDIGFGSDNNEVRLLMTDGREAESGLRSKLGVGLWLFEKLHEFGLVSN
ncbi:MAG: Coenzyme A biosynthesis bifunctional protein CoaBC [Fimbriimonadaceae bacterium]|nr:Coenzyme A biosynthesis bifunctional protein CoaBC [Fimbriimonadaceae bacterium]